MQVQEWDAADAMHGNETRLRRAAEQERKAFVIFVENSRSSYTGLDYQVPRWVHALVSSLRLFTTPLFVVMSPHRDSHPRLW